MGFIKNRKIAFMVLGGLVAALFLLYLLLPHAPKMKYITAKAYKGDMELSVLATGTLKPYNLVAVGARTTGRILSLKVKPGSVVKKGALLAQIDPTTQTNALDSKKAALEGMHAKLKEQEAQYRLNCAKLQRMQTLLKGKVISKQNFDETKTQVDVLDAEIKALQASIAQAEIDVATAKVNLDYTDIRAPIDGTVLSTLVQEGQNVNAVQSVPTLVILGDLSKMTVCAEISEADIIHVHPGQEIYFSIMGNPSKIYHAKLENLEPAPESIRYDSSFGGTSGSSNGAIYYNGTFSVDNADGQLRTYMTAEVHIVLGRVHQGLLIPSSALHAIKDNHAEVYLLNNKTLIPRSVTIGLNNKTLVEIKEGLKEGDVVVTASGDGKEISAPQHSMRRGPRF